MIVLIVIMIWCFYLRFVIAHLKRKKFMWVEVQDFLKSDYISRNTSKKNLYAVGEMTNQHKKNQSRFDKYWYDQREIPYMEGIYNS